MQRVAFIFSIKDCLLSKRAQEKLKRKESEQNPLAKFKIR